MQSKRSLPYDPNQLPPGRRLRENIADLFLLNTLPGNRSASIFADAYVSDRAEVRDVARAGARGMQPGNARRDLLRRLVRRSPWPRLYDADVRVWNNTSQQVHERNVPCCLSKFALLDRSRPSGPHPYTGADFDPPGGVWRTNSHCFHGPSLGPHFSVRGTGRCGQRSAR